MAAPLTSAERRVARFLFVIAFLGTLWNFVEGLRPPPPPVEIIRGALRPDSAGSSSLYDSIFARVSYEAGPRYPIDLSTAGTSELAALPGIGPVLAERIVTWRAGRSGSWGVEDLIEVKGIGPATLARIRPLVHVPEPAVSGGRKRPAGERLREGRRRPDSGLEWR